MGNGCKTTILVAGDDLEAGAALRDVISRDDVAIVEKPMTQAIEAFRDIGPDLVVLIFSDERARTRDGAREAPRGETEGPRTPGAAPHLDPEGLRACSGIRQSVRGEHVPILVVMEPDGSNTGAMERTYEVGATDVAIRPFSWPIVARRVGSLLDGKRMVDSLLRCEARFAGAQRMAKMGTWEYDRASGRVEASEELHRLLSVPPGSLHTLEDLIGRVHSDDRESLRKAIVESEILGHAASFQHRIENSDGQIRYIWGQVEPASSFEPGAGSSLLFSTIQDETDRVLARRQIQSLAHYDALTGLPNRVFLKRQLDIALAHSRRTKRSAAILFMDLDNFKHVNDSLGHLTGDRLLQGLADRLSHCLRATDTVSRNEADSPDSSLSRFGGDEFVILLTNLEHWEHAMNVVRRVFEVLEEPFVLEKQEVFVSVSIGISMFPSDGEDAERLLDNADVAMHHAKDRGRNTWQFYNITMNETSSRRLTIETNLRKALARDEFLLHYQPQIDARTGRMAGVEALIRWRRSGELISPAEFIPIADETGLIVPIGEWALQAACLQARQWNASRTGEPLRVSVNLSPRQFQTASVGPLIALIRASGLDPANLELEITESVLCRDVARTVEILEEFKETGARVCIDDFGTGYSSLSYLKRFPVDTLKIDRCFVSDIKGGEEALLTLAIVNLALNLRIDLVAEGVETVEQKDFLLRAGCPIMQGYLFGPPVEAEEITRLLDGENRGAASRSSSAATTSAKTLVSK